MALAFNKVTSLPGSLEPDSFYYVENGSYAEAYLTDDAGVAKSIGNSTMITALATAAANAVVADFNTVLIAADIAARDALVLDVNRMVLVTDASADATVTAGAALYAYNAGTTSFTKLSEFESMDVTVTWAAISGKPTSTPAQIDSAVWQAHSHTNKTVLDKFSEIGGKPYYNGAEIGGAVDWDTNNW